MKNSTLATFRLALFSVAVLGSAPLHAAATVEAHWTEVCRVAGDHALKVTTADGSTLEGYCVAIMADQMSVRTTDRGIVKIARSTLASIRMHVPESKDQGHELASLHRKMRSALKHEVNWLFSPSALLGVVSLPATLAWGAASAPFCAIGDLADKLTHESEKEQEIKVI
jgi:hypothetical protein